MSVIKNSKKNSNKNHPPHIINYDQEVDFSVQEIRGVRIKTQYKIYSEVVIPNDVELTICIVIIRYFFTPKFRRLRKSTRWIYVKSTNRFFDFILYENYRSDSEVGTDLFHRFVAYLRDELKLSGNGLKQTLGSIVCMVKLGMRLDEETEKNHFLLSVLANIPPISREENKKKPPLSMIFPDCPYSDKEIVTSLIHVSSWCIEELCRQRELLLNDKSVIRALEGALKDERFREKVDKKVKGYLLAKQLEFEPMCKGRMTFNSSDNERDYYEPLVRAILATEDICLVERLATDNSKLQKLIGLPPEEMHQKINKMLVYERSRKINTGNLTNMNAITFSDLLTLTEIEQRAVGWIFGALSIQASSLRALSIDNVIERNNKISIVYYKNRSRRPFRTPNQHVSLPVGKAIRSYLKQRKSCDSYLQDIKHQRNSFLIIGSPNIFNGLATSGTTVTCRFFRLLTMKEKSNTGRALIKDLGDKTISPFLWILDQWMDKAIGKSYQDYAIYSITDKKARSLAKKKFVGSSSVSLSANTVNESVNAMVSVPIVQPSTDMNISLPIANNESIYAEIDANTRSHSLETERNIYHSRIHTKLSIAAERYFAATLGKLMEEDADSMTLLKRRCEIIDINAANKLLGCEKNIDNFIELREKFALEVGDLGEFENGTKTIFVADKLTVALILQKIDHIEVSLPQLLEDSIFQKKAKSAYFEWVFLSELLKRFPEYIFEEGIKFSENHKFPFALMV